MSPSTSKLLPLCLLLAAAGPAAAHSGRVAAVEVQREADALEVRYLVSLPDLVALVPHCDPNDDGLLTRAESQQVLTALGDAVARDLFVEADGRRLRPRLEHTVFPPVRAVALGDPQARVGVALRYPAHALDSLALRSRVFPPAHTTRELVTLPDGGAASLAGPGDVVRWSAPRSFAAQLLGFVSEGVAHILAGWDHLAFLLALLILAPTVRGVITTVTAFTLAHSLTLALTAARLVDPPSALVESAIALSIAWVAFENLTGLAEGASRQRWLLTFAFGLVHGMGFGSVLLELNLGDPVPTLLGFNLGVELGQLGVIALVWPLLAGLRGRSPRAYELLVVKGLSLVLIAVGVFACVNRLV